MTLNRKKKRIKMEINDKNFINYEKFTIKYYTKKDVLSNDGDTGNAIKMVRVNSFSSKIFYLT